MKIKIQYPSNQANPAVVEVDTDDTGLTPTEQLRHASDAVDVALKVLWEDRAKPTQPESKVTTFTGPVEIGAGYLSILPGTNKEDTKAIVKAALEEDKAEQKRIAALKVRWLEWVKFNFPDATEKTIEQQWERFDKTQDSLPIEQAFTYLWTHNISVDELVKNEEKFGFNSVKRGKVI